MYKHAHIYTEKREKEVWPDVKSGYLWMIGYNGDLKDFFKYMFFFQNGYNQAWITFMIKFFK